MTVTEITNVKEVTTIYRIPLYLALQFKKSWAQKIKHLRSTFFWEITQRTVDIYYRRFGTTHLSHLNTRSAGGASLPESTNGVCFIAF
jgi:hypothetical protein